MNKEEKELIERARLIEDLMTTEGWKYAERKLNQMLAGVDSVRSLQDTVQLHEVLARKYAQMIVLEWMSNLKGEITAAEQLKDAFEVDAMKSDIYTEK